MNADITEKRRKETEDLISQIEECLTEHLLKENQSKLHQPFPAVVRHVSRPSSNRSSLSPSLEAIKKASPVYPTSVREHMPRMNTKAFRTSVNGVRTNKRDERDSNCGANSPTDGELSSLHDVFDTKSDVKWLQLQQTHSNYATNSTCTTEKKGFLETAHLPSPPLDEDHYRNYSPLPASSSLKLKSNTNKAVLNEGASFPNRGTKTRSALGNIVDKTIPDSFNKKGTIRRQDGRLSKARQGSPEAQTAHRSRLYKPTDSISDRQTTSQRALQRRLEYDPQASVAKERVKAKMRESEDSRSTEKDNESPAPMCNGDTAAQTRPKFAKQQLSLDSTLKKRAKFKTNKGLEASSSSQTVRNQNSGNVGRNGEVHRRGATTSPLGRARNERRKTRMKDSTSSCENSEKYPPDMVEMIRRKLEGLAKHVVHLRKLVERDYSEMGYCSPGDDIYVDEEVGATSKGRPTGMHPAIASSLRSIRLLEGNFQEIFDLLYANEVQIWSSVGPEGS